jgi:hypothetical protein
MAANCVQPVEAFGGALGFVFGSEVGELRARKNAGGVD